MKCRECPDYAKCVKESNLAIKRKNCPKAKTEKVKTNADRIRAMSDGELADVIANGVGCVLKAPHCMDTDCTPCILKWLKQPWKENDNAENEAT